MNASYGDVDLNEDIIKFHKFLVDAINQFFRTKVSKQTNCKQSWLDNEVKNLASLKSILYQIFLLDKSESSKKKKNQINKLQKLRKTLSVNS